MRNSGFTRTTLSESADRRSDSFITMKPIKPRTVKVWSGFTFIELILYVGLISIFLGGLVQFYRAVSVLKTRSRVAQETTHNIQLAGKRLAYEIRSASAINSITSTSLCLASSDVTRNPTYLYVSQNRLRIGWGGGSGTCTGLTNDHPLTSNLVNISGFNFQNLSNTVTKNVHYSFIISYASTNQRKEWTRSEVVSGSAEVRSF